MLKMAQGKIFFSEITNYKLGSRRNYIFWHFKWMGDQILKEAYPKAYEELNNSFISVEEGGVRNGRVWLWSWLSNAEDHGSIEAETCEIFYLLQDIEPDPTAGDNFK